MDRLLYLLARGLVALLGALPLPWVAGLGRAGGALAWWLDGRHRRVALRNLTRVLGGEKSPRELRRLARANFRRIGESFACAVKTARLSWEALCRHVTFVGVEHLPRAPTAGKPPSVVVALGHFGNFELYARAGEMLPHYQCVTTYRALRPAALNRLLQSLRERSGCRYYERRTEFAALKAAMAGGGILLGLLADQHAGRRGARLPFLGHECSTSVAPAVLALRYGCPLHVAVCYRTAPARWRVELSPAIPTHQDGRPRSTRAIMREVNRAFEQAVRRDPANWFWVHNRWKFPPTDGPRPERAAGVATPAGSLKSGPGG